MLVKVTGKFISFFSSGFVCWDPEEMLKMLSQQLPLVFNVIYHSPFTAELLLLTLYFCFSLFSWDVTLICLHIFYSFQLCKNCLICITTWTLANTIHAFSQDWRNTCTGIMKKHRIVSWRRLWQYLCVCKRTLKPLTEGSQSISVMVPVLLNKPRAAAWDGAYLLFIYWACTRGIILFYAFPSQ